MSVQLPSEPITRKEQYLAKAAGQAVEVPAEPITREEAYLDAIAKGGSGGGGTNNYNDLSNQPQINGTTLVGNKTASQLGLASTADLARKVDKAEGYGLSENNYTDADKASVATIAGKQDALTAGTNIKIDDDTISVNRWAVPAGKVVYTVITSDENYGQNVHVQRHTLGGALIDDRTFLCEMYKTVNVDNLISIYNPYASLNITLLKDSDEHQSGYSYTVNPITTPTSTSFTFMMEQEENDNDLIIREELDAVSSAVSAIKNGTSIDSFADVETALSGKQATLTFDSVPTDGSTNPVESNGVYDALALKQNATDNNLQTTDKTVVGAINEHEGDIGSLMSGLTNLDVALDVPNGTGKNLVDATTFDSYTSDKGITVTPNGTGGIAFSGTNSGTGATGVLLLKSGYGIQLKAGKTYRFSGNWSGITHGSTSIRLDLRPYNTLDVLASESNDGIGTFTPSEDMTVRMFARVAGSYAIPNDVIAYPMLTELADATFAPYIPSVESRIEAVESNQPVTVISVTADGVKTYAEILEQMKTYFDDRCRFYVDNFVYQQMSPTRFCNIIISASSGNVIIQNFLLASGGNTWYKMTLSTSGNSNENISNTVAPSGSVFKIVKNA